MLQNKFYFAQTWISFTISSCSFFFVIFASISAVLTRRRCSLIMHGAARHTKTQPLCILQQNSRRLFSPCKIAMYHVPRLSPWNCWCNSQGSEPLAVQCKFRAIQMNRSWGITELIIRLLHNWQSTKSRRQFFHHCVTA